jgi:hypothetical protein
MASKSEQKTFIRNVELANSSVVESLKDSMPTHVINQAIDIVERKINILSSQAPDSVELQNYLEIKNLLG